MEVKHLNRLTLTGSADIFIWDVWKDKIQDKSTAGQKNNLGS